MTWPSEIADGKPAIASPVVSALTDYQGIGNNLTPRDANGAPENNTRDIGTSSYKWKDLYLAGAASVDGAITAGSLSLTAQPMCQLYLASLTVNSGETAINFTTEYVDVGSMHSTVFNTDRISVPSGMGGIYSISLSYQTDASITGKYPNVRIKKNGTQIYICSVSTPSSGIRVLGGGTLLYSLSAGDYVSLTQIENSGGSSIYMYEILFSLVRVS